MSGFGSLYYTDCLPGQGLQGGAGFQFQAATPGAVTEAMPLVQRTVLYEPPSAWTRDRRPVDAFPHSLAHAFEDGVFATAAGRYLGQEANGTRQGNQFTHAVVTRDPADYGLVRPAQLWDAPWWATEPGSSTELVPLPAHPAAGPLDTETVRDRVRDTPDGEERLVALLSAVQHLADPENRRTVVLVSAEPEVAACWIAAVTLLLPCPDALRATFKIFVADAQYGRHDIIALHPEWAGRWADTGSGSGLAVFDLDRGRHTVVEPTASAQFWVPRFLTEDAYDVVDAVELAGQFAHARTDGAGTAGSTPADRSVALVMAAGERLADPARLDEAADWLRTAPEEAIRVAHEVVLDAVLEARPPAPVLRSLVDAAGARGLETDAGIQLGLLTAEVGEVLAAPDGVAALRAATGFAPLRLRDLAAGDSEQSRSDVEAALRAARADQVPALLTVAARHGVSPFTGQFRDSAQKFAVWWLERGEPELEPERWPAPPDALDWVRDVLRSSLKGPGKPRAVDVVCARWWVPLWEDAQEPADALDALLMTTAYGNLKGPQRTKLMRHVQTVSVSSRIDGAAPSTIAWNILFGRRPPSLAEAREFVRGLTELEIPMSLQVATQLSVVIERETKLSEAGLWIAHAIRQQGHTLSKKQADLAALDADVAEIIQDLAAKRPRRPDAEISAALDTAALPLLKLRMEKMVDALIGAPRGRALAVLRRCSWETLAPIYLELETRWPQQSVPLTRTQCDAAAFTFSLVTGKPGSGTQKVDFGVLKRRLGKQVGAMSKEDRSAVERAANLGPEWWAWVSEVEPKRWSLSRLSRSGKHSGRGE